MWFRIINWERENFPCNNNWCKSCDKTESCDRFKQEKKSSIKSDNVRLEWQKTLDEIQKYLY